MFQLPEAKRVRREDLNTSDGSAWGGSEDDERDAELRARLNAQIAKSLGLDESYSQSPGATAARSQPILDLPSTDTTSRQHSPASAQEEVDEDPADEEFLFRLFSTARPTQKVILEHETELKGDGALAAGRPLSYYAATNATGKERQEYDFAAMSGDEILARSKHRTWGLELPWKLTTITVTRNAGSGVSNSAPRKEEDDKRRRPGKKQRIILRKLAKAKAERTLAQAQKLVEKEEHIKDKKKRLNRLKKLKKRAKAKEEKKAAKAGDPDAMESDEESDDSDE
ncbi:hypothetical protein G7046_g8749 [Stylonectria norvegica]|nr:hypothetical protein G7046_g8749 [Stylonectria norvegica]